VKNVIIVNTRHLKSTHSGQTSIVWRCATFRSAEVQLLWYRNCRAAGTPTCRVDGDNCCARRSDLECGDELAVATAQLPVAEQNRQNSDDLRSMSAKSQGDPGEDHISRCHESWLRPLAFVKENKKKRKKNKKEGNACSFSRGVEYRRVFDSGLFREFM